MGSIEQRLTDFQIATEELLAKRLREKGLSVSEREVEGRSEPFIRGTVGGVKVWIYADGACVIGRGVDRVLEKWDYSSPDELREAFVRQVTGLFDGDQPAQR